jgi:hypothetical protein
MTTLKADKFTPTLNFDLTGGSEFMPTHVKDHIENTIYNPVADGKLVN